jgi:hypothetical protein
MWVMFHGSRHDLNGLHFLVLCHQKRQTVSARKEKNQRTHSNVTLCQERGNLWLSCRQFLEQVSRWLKATAVAEVFEYTGSQVVGNNSSDLDLGVRSDLPSYTGISTLDKYSIQMKHSPFINKASAACKKRSSLSVVVIGSSLR